MDKKTLDVKYSIFDSYQDIVEVALKAGNLGYIKFIDIERLLGNFNMCVWLKENIDIPFNDDHFNIIAENFYKDQIDNYRLTINENLQLQFTGELTL